MASPITPDSLAEITGILLAAIDHATGVPRRLRRRPHPAGSYPTDWVATWTGLAVERLCLSLFHAHRGCFRLAAEYLPEADALAEMALIAELRAWSDALQYLHDTSSLPLTRARNEERARWRAATKAVAS